MARPPAFQPEEALEKAMLTFWRLGYEQTAVSDLVEATGVNRHSLYATWGDKRGLYLAALDHYLALIRALLLAEMLTPGADLASVEAFGGRLLEVMAEPPGAFGCLIALAASEQAGRDPEVSARIDEHTRLLRDAFGNALRGARDRGQLREGESVEALTDMLTVFSRGLSLEIRRGADPALLRRSVSATLASLRSPGGL